MRRCWSGREAGRARDTLRVLMLLAVASVGSAGRASASDGEPRAEVAGHHLAEARRLFEEGRYSQALPEARRACALREKALGAGPELAEALNLLGDVLL